MHEPTKGGLIIMNHLIHIYVSGLYYLKSG
jgi:hypothetical protein